MSSGEGAQGPFCDLQLFPFQTSSQSDLELNPLESDGLLDQQGEPGPSAAPPAQSLAPQPSHTQQPTCK